MTYLGLGVGVLLLLLLGCVGLSEGLWGLGGVGGGAAGEAVDREPVFFYYY